VAGWKPARKRCQLGCLGLAIYNEIVQVHNGSIRAEHIPEGGSSFRRVRLTKPIVDLFKLKKAFNISAYHLLFIEKQIESYLESIGVLRIKKAEDRLRQQLEQLQETVSETKSKLQLSEEKIRLLLEETDEGIWSWDLKTGEVQYNDNWIRILGYSPGERTFDIDWWQKNLHPDSKILREIALADYLAGRKKYYELEYQLRGKYDRWIWVIVRGICVARDDEGNPLKILGTLRDISRRKNMEVQLQASLKEKETLLHEIHHRVKNNMAVIISLLKLQADKTEDNHIKEALKEGQLRVYAMSAVHETLHGSTNLSEIALKAFLSKIARVVFQTYSITQDNVELQVDMEDIQLSINQASPLGLVMNELISNSLKYAFPGERRGKITVGLTLQDTKLELTIADDGVGIPDGFDWKNSNSLGMQLVRTLIENQLDGAIDMDHQNGTKFTIRFNIGA